jgi:hypothetical protein
LVCAARAARAHSNTTLNLLRATLFRENKETKIINFEKKSGREAATPYYGAFCCVRDDYEHSVLDHGDCVA